MLRQFSTLSCIRLNLVPQLDLKTLDSRVSHYDAFFFQIFMNAKKFVFEELLTDSTLYMYIHKKKTTMKKEKVRT